MWSYLEHLANLLENVAKVLHVASSKDINALRTVHRSTSLSGQSPVINRLSQLTSVSVPDVTGNKTYTMVIHDSHNFQMKKVSFYLDYSIILLMVFFHYCTHTI